MEKVKIKTEYIKLDQFIKWVGLVGNGSDAKILIADGQVLVNDLPELRRGKKLRIGDSIKLLNKEFIIEQGDEL